MRCWGQSRCDSALLHATVGLALLGIAGCTPPVGVTRLSLQDMHRQVGDSALTTDGVSDQTQIVLRRHDLVQTFADHPEVAIGKLREVVVSGEGGNDELFALAELSYAHGLRTDSRPDELAAAVYAYAFLFPDDSSQRPAGIDPRYRWACELYAGGLSEALRAPDGRALTLQAGSYPLPFGTLDVDFDPQDLVWSERVLVDFVPVAEYEVHGLRNRYRQPGIGVPLAAKTVALAPVNDDLVDEGVRVPATVVLVLDEPRRQLANSALHGHLEVVAATEREEVPIAGADVPLEIDRTGSVAVTLSDTAYWERELSSFLGSAVGVHTTARLGANEPYRPGRIPVVFVHGTNSSPGRWADMVNDLENDPRIRRRFQFWFFSYDSGNPIAYSAMLLRRALLTAVTRFDHDGRDACLHEMVVVGHSQGGLLTKMTVIDSGSAFWDSISGMPFDQVRLSDKSRAMVEEALFIKPLPFITRVVFIATPHGGSYLAGPSIVRRLAAKLISMPRDLTAIGTDLVAVRDPAKRMVSLERFPTSIDNMSPGNPFIKTLGGIPIAPGVAAHSIIPVEGDGPLEDGADGVVAYKSAHIEGVESERVVRPSSHSTQSNPQTVDEVRRILLRQAETHPCAVAPPADTSEKQPRPP